MKPPYVKTTLPGPIAKSIVERDHQVTAPAYGRVYPLGVKLASGMTVPARLKDLADVLATIRALELRATLADELHPFVRGKYLELWCVAQSPDALPE